MKKIILIFVFISFTANSQQPGFNHAGYNKSISLYRAKEFVIKEVLGVEEKQQVRFVIDPLAASNSGELTSLSYVCDEKKIKGFVLGFFKQYYNEYGIGKYQYKFLNFTEEKARYILLKLATLIKSEAPRFADNPDHNIYFQYDGIIYLIYNDFIYSGDELVIGTKIRVFWDEFDSEWSFTAFERTRRRFQKNMK